MSHSWTTKTELLSHQKEAVDKLLKVKASALFMEMGTGKTRTAIEFARLRTGKFDKLIWFCPVSIKKTIYNEILKHTSLEQEKICFFDSKTNPKNIPKDCAFYIVGLESMGSSDRVILTVASIVTDKTFIVVDESSFIKGHKSARTLNITKICSSAKYRMLLTGTPITQGVQDLYAQMKFLSQKILGYNSFYAFAANHLEYSEKYKNLIVAAHNIPYITSKVAPYSYQITKRECLDLPFKTYKKYEFKLTLQQKDEYQKAKEDILYSVPDDEITSYTIFQLFSALQQITSGFRYGEPSIKMEHYRIRTLKEVLQGIPLDKKIIIWCKYSYSLQHIYEELSKKYGNISLHYGDLTEKERAKSIEKFRKDGRIFLSTMATGGYGLTLTEASYAIFYENEFKYSHRLQAEDRIHRIGQNESCTYIDIVSVSGIEERIMDSMSKKENTVSSFKRKLDEYKKLNSKSLKQKLLEDL